MIYGESFNNSYWPRVDFRAKTWSNILIDVSPIDVSPFIRHSTVLGFSIYFSFIGSSVLLHYLSTFFFIYRLEENSSDSSFHRFGYAYVSPLLVAWTCPSRHGRNELSFLYDDLGKSTCGLFWLWTRFLNCFDTTSVHAVLVSENVLLVPVASSLV